MVIISTVEFNSVCPPTKNPQTSSSPQPTNLLKDEPHHSLASDP